MRRKSVAVILLLAVAIWFGLAYLYPIVNPVHVDAARVERGTLYPTVRGAGLVTAKALVPVTPPAPARVISLSVSLGQEVKKGDELALLELLSPESGAPSAAPSPTAPGQPGPPSPATTSPGAVTPSPQPEVAPSPTVVPQNAATPTPPPSPSPAPLPSPSPAPPSPAPSPSPTPGPPPPTPVPPSTEAAPSPTPPAPAPPAPPAPPASYTVQPGDTLSEIAQRFGTTVEEIARINGIGNPDLIYPGQQLDIPQSRPPQGRSFSAFRASVVKAPLTITSPVDGQVVKIEVRPGQTVAVSTPLLTLADTTSLYLDMLVDQEDLAELRIGQSAQIVLDALSRETVRGKVEEISPLPVTGTMGIAGYPARVTLEAPPEGTRLGMTGQAEVITKKLANVLFVPRRAVLERRGEAYVFVVEEDRVTKTLITLGRKTRDYYEVQGGLADGQIVVATNLDEMEDGLRVSVDRILGPK